MKSCNLRAFEGNRFAPSDLSNGTLRQFREFLPFQQNEETGEFLNPTKKSIFQEVEPLDMQALIQSSNHNLTIYDLLSANDNDLKAVVDFVNQNSEPMEYTGDEPPLDLTSINDLLGKISVVKPYLDQMAEQLSKASSSNEGQVKEEAVSQKENIESKEGEINQ